MATIRHESPFNRAFVRASSDVVDVKPKSNAERARTSLLRSLRRTIDKEIIRRDWQNKFAEEEAAKNANDCVTKAMGTQASSDQTRTASTLVQESRSTVTRETKAPIVLPVKLPIPPKACQTPHPKTIPIPKVNPVRHSSTPKWNYPTKIYFWNIMWIGVVACTLSLVLLNTDKTMEVWDDMRITSNTLVTTMKAGAESLTLLSVNTPLTDETRLKYMEYVDSISKRYTTNVPQGPTSDAKKAFEMKKSNIVPDVQYGENVATRAKKYYTNTSVPFTHLADDDD